MSKRARSKSLPFHSVKRTRTQGNSEQQEIWKNLDGIRTQYEDAESAIANSYLFIPIFSRDEDYEPCIDALEDYIGPTKLQLHGCAGTVPAYVVLLNFSLMDCCLVLTTLFGFKSKKWTTPSHSKDYFSIPRELVLSGCFYLPNSCTRHDNKNVPIYESRFETSYNFKEYYIKPHTNPRHFMRSVAAFFSDVKFCKSAKITSKHFSRALAKSYGPVEVGIKEIPFLGEGLYNVAQLAKTNLPLIENAKMNMQTYAQDLIKYNSAALSTENPVSNSKTQASRPSQSPKPQQQSSMRTNTSSIASRPNFMTQDQIKQHCTATVKASQEVVKTKSPYQILKTYVKCPRQGYIDKVYQNLNELRAQTNCNIVVLNLNNLHEARPWFDLLDVSKFTSHAQQPHPSTVRVVSIGGIGEHVIKALDLIYNIMQQ